MIEKHIEQIHEVIHKAMRIPLEQITDDFEIPDPTGLMINIHMTHKWWLKLPERSGDYFAEQAKPVTLGELKKLN